MPNVKTRLRRERPDGAANRRQSVSLGSTQFLAFMEDLWRTN